MTFFQSIVRMIRRRPQAYIGLMLNTVITSAVTFAYATFVFHPQLQMVLHEAKILFMIMFSMLIFCSFFSLFYSLLVLYKERQEQFGIFLLLGMKSQYLRVMLVSETMLIGCCSIGMGILLGMGLNTILVYFIDTTIRYLELKYHFSLKALGVTAISSLLLFLLAAVVMPSRIQGRNIIRFIQGGRGGAGYKSNPSISAFRAVISFLSLGSMAAICVFLPLNIFGNPPGSVVFTFSICLFLTLIGSYLFYREGSVSLASFFRWNRNFSWKGVRLLWIGNTVYRLRDNARFFFLVSMLFMFVFTSASAVSFIKRGVDKIQDSGSVPDLKIMPELVYSISDRKKIAPHEWHEFGTLDQLLRSGGLLRVNSNLLILTRDKNPYPGLPLSGGTEEHRSIEDGEDKAPNFRNQTKLRELTGGLFLKASDYNAMAQKSGKPTLSLGSHTAALLCNDPGCARDKRIASNLLPEYFRVQERKYLSNASLVLPWYSIPQWVLGDKMFDEVSRCPGIHKLQNANYVVPQGKMSARMLEALMKAEWMGRDGHRPWSGMGVVHNRVSTLEGIWHVVFVFISVLIVALVFAIVAANFLLLRIYTDMEGMQRQFINLLRIGFSSIDLRKSITKQISLIFFLPLSFATTLTVFALCYGVRFLDFITFGKAGDQIFLIALTASSETLAMFLGIQVIMFFLVRAWIFNKFNNMNKQWL
ncbi:FtsX-like permease family protein [Pasteuria penetrans]|uniref:FtsX-like permease family protein n=1 Tax=Pasteuria penetrans TaxID=86005 RepID=UPI000F9B2BC2|nr:FtsX-like permease family protein [Pasteuria penetrans]